jgi:DNA-binding response OmpR family regulator
MVTAFLQLSAANKIGYLSDPRHSSSRQTMRILLIEDHSRLADSIIKGLAGLGFGVDAFETAGDGLNAFKSIAYDAIILDLGLPDRDGLDLLGELRQSSPSAPILILTARDGIDARVSGLDAGADDYVVKPFAMTELAARLRALLRRPGQALGGVLVIGNLQLQTISRHVIVNGTAVRFPIREVEALELLMRREGQVVAKDTLEDNLYGLTKNVTPNSIEVLISRLRRRLISTGADCSIHTLYGIGYLLKENRH